MASGINIRTFFQGRWHDGNIPIMRAADHGSWLGSTVFDGARSFDGMAPDLALHCARVNRSAGAMLLTPTMGAQEIEGLAREGLKFYRPDQATYIRPMYCGGWRMTATAWARTRISPALRFALRKSRCPRPITPSD